MASRERVVEFAVKARDEYSKVLKNLEQQQKRVSAAAQASNRRAVVGVAKGEIESAVANYKRLSTEVDRYRAVQANAARTGSLSASEMRELGETIKLVRDRSREAMGALQQKRAALQQINGEARVGFSSFSRLATEMQRGAVASTNESVALVNTTAELNKLTTASKKATTAQGALGDRMDSVSGAGGRDKKKGSSTAGDPEDILVYGLRPWQLTNLGYQVNDVVSGLAMGQAPLQVLAQQAGQFAQIWPNVMVSVARSIPQLVLLGGVLAPFIAVAMRLKEAGDSVEYFQRKLALSADGYRNTAQGLAGVSDEIKKLGISIDDARSLAAGFAADGLPTGQFAQFAKIAKSISDATGEGVVDAGQRLSQAFGGNVESVLELNKELNFLTLAQYDQVRAMKASGDEAGAMAFALDALKTRAAESKVETSEWGKTLVEAKGAWNDFVQALQDTGVIQFVSREIQYFGRDIRNMTRDARAGAKALKDVFTTDLEDRIRDLRTSIQIEESLRSTGFTSGAAGMFGEDNLSKMKSELATLVSQRRELVEHVKDESLYSEKAYEATKKTVAATEQKKVAAREAVYQLQEQMSQETRLAQLTERQQYIEQKALEAKNKLLAEGVRLRQEEIDAELKKVRSSAGAAYDAQRFGTSGAGYNSVADRIAGIESGGNPTAKNPNSTATGLGQFIESTWLRMFKQYFPDRAKGMTDSTILALRENADVSRSMIELYARENAAILQKAGVAVNEASVYLAHFLGPTGAVAVLTAQADTPVSKLLSSDAIKSNRNILEGKTAGEVASWANQKAGTSPVEVEAQARLTEMGREYLTDYRKRVEQQQFELNLLSKSAKEAAVAKALRDEELKAREAGKDLTKEQRAETERLAALEFDRNNVNQKVNELLEKRSTLMERMDLAQQSGDQSLYATTYSELDAVNGKLNEAIASAIAFWQAMGGEGSVNAIASLQNIEIAIGQSTQRMRSQFLPTAEDINRELAEIGSTAWSSFAEAIAKGENAADAFFRALQQGIAEFLIDIGKAIVKQALFNALTGGKDANGGIGGTIAGAISKVFGAKHSGGIVGNTTQSRRVNPMVFAGAQRYHGGGIVSDGLRQGEVPIVALEGEEVLTENDPRHSANGGGGKAVNLKVVNAFDPVEVMEAALSSVAGERVMTNWITRNQNKLNGALGR
ncbi:hypothetical protein G6L74_09350 [Agrobacterium tumefaciens]|uniref:phage tail length tape measure family protein n=1 Tax=Agrobacterium tumefaciens TaxID=358 RepID=UPI001574C1E1|nr:hypothetical protein [Agrobacterium tumefaciens]